MKTSVIIDSCAWNYLFIEDIDLATALPKESFTLTMPRELEIEISAIPDVGKTGKNGVVGEDKRALKAYIASSIASNNIVTSSVFGFATCEPDGSLSPVQVHGGFDQGTFQSEADRDFYNRPEIRNQIEGKEPRPTGLSKNQGDAAVAVRSFSSVVLTNESKNKVGPIKIAADMNGRIAYLEDFVSSGKSLAEYVLQFSNFEDSAHES